MDIEYSKAILDITGTQDAKSAVVAHCVLGRLRKVFRHRITIKTIQRTQQEKESAPDPNANPNTAH